MPHIDADSISMSAPQFDSWVQLPATPCLSSLSCYSLPILPIVPPGMDNMIQHSVGRRTNCVNSKPQPIYTVIVDVKVPY